MSWTNEELSDLKELLQTETREDAGKALCRSIHSVKRAIKKYSIKYPKKTGSNYKLRRTWPDDLTQEQKEVLVGSLLGDGMITKKFSCFRMKQCRLFREYVEYMSDFFNPYMTGHIHDGTGMCRGKVIKSSVCYTHTGPRFVALRKKWYPNNTKIVPRDIRLTPLMCAHWQVQDGHNRQNRREVMLHTNGFTRDDVEFLVRRLKKDVGIKSHVVIKKNRWGNKNQKKEYPVIYIGNQYGDEGYFQFLDLVRPYVTWDCFQYKVDVSKSQKHKDRPGPKLDINKAQKIRALYNTEKYSQKQIGKMFDCSQGIVSQIVNNQIHIMKV